MDGAEEEGGDLRIQDQDQDQSRSPAASEQKCPALCDVLHGSIQDRENSPMMRATLCGQVCKLYRFQTEDGRWLLVLEQMSETPLCFSLPKQLLSALSVEHTNRILDLNELGELPPHWAGLRQDVVQHCNQLIALYQETLTEIDKLSEGDELVTVLDHVLAKSGPVGGEFTQLVQIQDPEAEREQENLKPAHSRV
ncbi:unnamed protein product [Menidia menidia]|uniref:(Atlantic silverside) hypothetical protein n=1 Tax=Menidia menidia TaxID=238744 RepID=A0A8S4AV33_9TELE|nr:unnamed protein product [Menidia menidia]